MDQQTANAASLAKGLRTARHFSVLELLLAVAALSALLAGYSAARTLGASAVALLVGITLWVVGWRYGASRYRVGGLFITIPSLCIFSVLFAAWLVFGIGPVFTQRSWPAPLTRMAETACPETRNVKVACLYDALDAEYVWRLPVSPDRFENVKREFNFSPISAAAAPQSFIGMFPWRWRPVPSDQDQFYSGSARGKATFVAVYCADEDRLYVWYHFDF